MHIIEGTIIEGSKRASELGFPTINLAYESVHQPDAGVYAGSLLYDGEEYRGAACLAPNGKLEIHCFQAVPLKHIKEASIALYEKVSEYVVGDDGTMRATIAGDIEKSKRCFADLERTLRDS
ncbi:MAG: riboflavin kinase [Patescibacteria group bacterium]